MKLVGFVGALALVGLIAVSDTDARQRDKAAKAKGYIRPGWGQLGLSNDQKEKIYTVQTKYKAKIEELEQQIKNAKDAQYKEELAVLTAAQRQKLKDALDPDEKKPGTSKKGS